MVLPCIEVKRFEKTCFPAREYCNMGCNDRPTQFSSAEVGTGNYKNGTCALSYAPPLFGLLLYCRRFVQYGVRNCESTSNYGSVLLFHLCDRFSWRGIRLQWRRRQKVGGCSAHATQGGCRVRQLCRSRSEILAIWAALKQLWAVA